MWMSSKARKQQGVWKVQNCSRTRKILRCCVHSIIRLIWSGVEAPHYCSSMQRIYNIFKNTTLAVQVHIEGRCVFAMHPHGIRINCFACLTTANHSQFH
mmetsp:Transcript_24462/g.58942  ORF Transcript_24462/g.58942 Transcript_24462/m.58942 type:complete len:99 (+) Transcript_24462:742-1038(+)